MLDSLKRIKKMSHEVWAVKMADRITNLQPPPKGWSAKKKEHYLENCPDLQAFSDISQFPHRIECLKLVMRGLVKLIN